MCRVIWPLLSQNVVLPARKRVIRRRLDLAVRRRSRAR